MLLLPTNDWWFKQNTASFNVVKIFFSLLLFFSTSFVVCSFFVCAFTLFAGASRSVVVQTCTATLYKRNQIISCFCCRRRRLRHFSSSFYSVLLCYFHLVNEIVSKTLCWLRNGSWRQNDSISLLVTAACLLKLFTHLQYYWTTIAGDGVAKLG